MNDHSHPYSVVSLSAEDTLALRQAVLWPSLSLDECRLEEDRNARHFGICVDGNVVCCFSIFDIGPGQVQLRKFATAKAFQRMGYGSHLLSHVIDLLKSEEVASIVLDARVEAIAFYEKNGFCTVSAPFDKNGLTHVRMERKPGGSSASSL